MDFLSYTYPGLESVLKKEILNRKFKFLEIWPWFVKYSGDISTLVKANLWLRTANKVYIVLNEFKANNFDELFNWIYEIDWHKYDILKFNLSIKPILHHSLIKSEISTQKIVQKAIYKKLWVSNHSPSILDTLEIRVDIFKNVVKVLLDTSGDPLYKRGYKLATAQASIKETLAAWLILLVNCKNEDFVDPFCGSWTILIEKALIDLNIAPGTFRNFIFEKFNWIDPNLLKKEKWRASTRIKTKKLNFYGYDISSTAIQIAQENIKNAWLEEFIKLQVKDYLKLHLNFPFITNPPYGKRLTGNFDHIYKKLKDDLKQVKCGWIITSYKVNDEYFDLFKVRKLSNWWEWVNFFYKQN